MSFVPFDKRTPAVVDLVRFLCFKNILVPKTTEMKELLILLLATGCFAQFPRKCCPDNEIFVGKSKCGTAGKRMIFMNCTKILLREIVLDGYKVSTLDSPGYVFVEDPNLYCVNKMYRNANITALGTIDVAVVCLEEISAGVSNNIETSGILTLISVVFLIATVVVYCALPQLRDLQGLCYLCMCISMALGFFSLGVLQLSPGFQGELCTLTGFLVYTWMMATFFWMNVISINMYRSVIDATQLKKTERKQYFYYSIYAWGCTAILLLITIITNFVEGDHWKPGFESGSCWFSGRTETWIFFYGPIAVLVTANIALFALSSVALWQHNKNYDFNKLNILKHKFLLSLKLFLVMGISWIFEIASFAHGQAHIIWKIMDIFNCLQGVIFFILLVLLRKRAMQGLANENFCFFLTRPLAEKLSPHDEADDELIIDDDKVEVRLN